MKFFVTISFLFSQLFLSAQGIFVDLRIEKFSPLISGYSRAEMENLIKDSILTSLSRGYIERTEKVRNIKFNPIDDHDYVVEFVLIDTVDTEAPEKYKRVRLVTMNYKVYERGLPAHLMPKSGWFGVGYTDYSGNLYQGDTEEYVIRTYCNWSASVLSSTVLPQIPDLKYHNLTKFNISQDEVKSFNYFKEILITKTNFDSSKRVLVIDRLLNNALLNEQDFYYGIRSKKNNYINIYDSYNDTFTDNPIRFELVLSSSQNGYKIQLIIDKNLITQHPNYHVPKEIEFSVDQLEYAPSQVLYLMNDMFKKLFRLNLN